MNKTKIKNIIIIIILLIGIILLSIRTYNHWTIFKDHKISTSGDIKEWMPVNFLINYMNINEDVLFKELNISNTWNARRKPLEEICIENQLNCTKIINNLNNIK